MKKIYKRWVAFSDEFKKKNISAYAASIAFFFFLSIVPILILICTILPHTTLTQQNLIDAVQGLVVPDMVLPLLYSLIEDVYGRSTGIMPLAIVAIIWSASKGVMALIHALNAVNDVQERRNYFVLRFIASVYTIVMLVVVILSLFLNVLGNQLLELVYAYFPKLLDVTAFLVHFRFLLVWVLFTVAFLFIFAFVPDKKLKLRDQFVGAVFAAVGWNVYSGAFSLYLTYGNGYGLYGSLAIVIIVLLWMYFCMYITLMGAFINHYRTEHQTICLKNERA